MYAVVNKQAGVATITCNLNDENDRQIFIMWMKQVVASSPESQLDIDRCIQAAGGTPEHGFPGYDLFQQ